MVAAAGNDGRGRVSYPARYPGVIAVAATQFDGKTTFYSNWGPEIDVAAPGELAVHPQRGFTIGEQCPSHRDHPAICRQRAKPLPARLQLAATGLGVADHRSIVPAVDSTVTSGILFQHTLKAGMSQWPTTAGANRIPGAVVRPGRTPERRCSPLSSSTAS